MSCPHRIAFLDLRKRQEWEQRALSTPCQMPSPLNRLNHLLQKNKAAESQTHHGVFWNWRLRGGKKWCSLKSSSASNTDPTDDEMFFFNINSHSRKEQNQKPKQANKQLPLHSPPHEKNIGGEKRAQPAAQRNKNPKVWAGRFLGNHWHFWWMSFLWVVDVEEKGKKRRHDLFSSKMMRLKVSWLNTSPDSRIHLFVFCLCRFCGMQGKATRFAHFPSTARSV